MEGKNLTHLSGKTGQGEIEMEYLEEKFYNSGRDAGAAIANAMPERIASTTSALALSNLASIARSEFLNENGDKFPHPHEQWNAGFLVGFVLCGAEIVPQHFS
jgi:hypothetical protein